MAIKPSKQKADEYLDIAKRFEDMAAQEERPGYKADLLHRAKHARGLAEKEAKKPKSRKPKSRPRKPKAR